MLCKATVTHEGLVWSPQQPGAPLVGLPATGRAVSSGISSASGTTILRETSSDFISIKKWLFNISSLSLALRLKKFLHKLRPGFATSWMQQGCSSAGTAGSTWKLSLPRPGECFPGGTGAIRAFEGNFLW